MDALLRNGEAALAELDAAFTEDPLIEEIGVVFTDTDAPRHGFVLEEHKLGMPAQLLKPLYAFAQQKLQKLQLHELQLSSHALISATRGMLLVKGDVTHAWHIRKRLIELGLLDLSGELIFVAALLTRQPKAPPAWEHRRWCLQRTIAAGVGPVLGRSPERLEVEQRLCASLAELHPKNYYAWNHRLWLLKFMSVEQLEAELRWMHEWMRTHVSDHSAANHLEQTVIALSSAAAGGSGDAHQAFQSTLAIVLQQIDLANAAVEARPGHETLWYHKRKLLLFALQLLTYHNPQIWSASGALSHECVVAVDSIESAIKTRLQQTRTLDPDTTQPAPVAQLTSYRQDANGTEQTSTLLWKLACSELAVACKALQNEQAWEYVKQRAAALRFAQFVLHSMLRYLTRFGKGDDAAPSHTHPLQVADASVHCDRLSSEHAFARRIAEFATLVSECLVREDELPRCWLHLQSQYRNILRQP